VNWSEEKYVKLFVRDTPTWRAWPWQARATAPLLMRVLESEGSLSVGRLDPTRAVALTVNLPDEVVAPGLAAMLEDGTLEFRDGRLWWPKFEEAQESRKSDALNSRDYRARQRTKRNAQVAEVSTTTRQTTSDAVRQRQTPSASSTAQHSTAQPERTAGRAPKRPRPEKPADPRHAPLVAELTKTFERETGAKYPFGPIDAAAVTALLAKAMEPTIVAAWTKALRSSAYPVVRTLAELVKHLAHFVGQTGPPARDAPVQHAAGYVTMPGGG
jgi:hypothetical protein